MLILGSKIALTAAATLQQGLRVKLDSSGNIVAAGVDEFAIGTIEKPAVNGDTVNVILPNAGIVEVVIDGAVAINAPLYGVAAGKVSDNDPGSATIRYRALEAGSADGQIISAIPVLN